MGHGQDGCQGALGNSPTGSQLMLSKKNHETMVKGEACISTERDSIAAHESRLWRDLGVKAMALSHWCRHTERRS